MIRTEDKEQRNVMEKFAPLNLTPDEIIRFTPEWQGERFEDGRPKVADDIVERMHGVTTTQAWGVLRGDGYNYQYADGFLCTQPGKVLVGRAVTVMYMPRREDLRAFIFEQALASGCIGDQVSWPIDTLVPGDIYVADIFGRVKDGPVIGDNLATSIYAKTGNGVVHDGAVRDIEGIHELEGFVSFCRGLHPSVATPTVILAGINCPVRIGEVTVMPGDVVLARDDGVVFVPPQLALETVESAEIVTLKDEFGTMRIREGVYGPGEVDRAWSELMNDDFRGWLRSVAPKRGFSAESLGGMLDRLAGKRTW